MDHNYAKMNSYTKVFSIQRLALIIIFLLIDYYVYITLIYIALISTCQFDSLYLSFVKHFSIPVLIKAHLTNNQKSLL